MARQAAPYREGAGWSMRRRVFGQDLYVSGHSSQTAARQAMEALVKPLSRRGQPKGLGPRQTTLAQALQDYALERLPCLKGAPQEARRINRYLRAVGMATVAVVKTRDAAAQESKQPAAIGAHQRFVVTLEPPRQERPIPQGLGAHRRAQELETAAADKLREQLARMRVADVLPYHVQDFIDDLRKCREPATLQLERALLRSLFNYARNVWCWSEPASNPATGLRMPKVDNQRDRVMSHDEQRRLDEAIGDCRNALVAPTLELLRETAMRSSEPLERAVWSDVDWQHKLIRLRDSKSDSRQVPLSPAAIAALEQLAALNAPQPDAPIVQMSYDALAAAWRRACERAGVLDLRIHDLRHTSATRMALKTGNVFLVKALTGHKTLSQLERYVNVKAADVVAVMHAPEPKPTGNCTADELEDVVGNLVRGNFGKRRVVS